MFCSLFKILKRGGRCLFSLYLPLALIALLLQTIPSNQSIGYFESYGWPTYGIVKPFWMAPFSTFPTSQTSGYSRSHRILSAGIVRNRPGANSNLGF